MSDTAYPTFQHYGTAAQRAAFTPSPAGSTQPIYIWRETDTGNVYLYDTSWHQIAASGATVYPSTIEGRLTTESGVPVSTSDRTAQGTIYYTPTTTSGVATTNGNLTLYNGTALANVAFTQLSLALTVSSGSNYDVFVDYNSGTPQLVLSAAWTNDTTRADALGLQSGVVIKSGTATYRWVGTIRGSAANVTEDSATKRFVWNAFNQVRSFLSVVDTTNTWTWNTAAWHQANASTANQVEYVSGSASQLVSADVWGHTNGGSGIAGTVGVGIDSTTANSAQQYREASAGINNGEWVTDAHYRGFPGLGYHKVIWLEYARAGTVTFLGDSGVVTIQTGLAAETLR